jgi:beta-glucosidase
MKKSNSFVIVLLAAIVVRAELSAVTVDTSTLHMPNPLMGIAFSGMVEYSLAPTAAFDSVYVSVTISPAAGGANLVLTELSGDAGWIYVNTNKPNAAKTCRLFFQASNARAQVYYIAHITADANPSKAKAHADSLIKVMSKSSKATLMTPSGGMESASASPIPNIFMADGPYGVRGNGDATCFPTCAGLCATWDTALAFAQGAAKGEEFRGLGRNCQLGPADDLVYHPQGGRASEYFGEDPYLSGRMLKADVWGSQSKGCIATIKHFACNNKEQNRESMSAVMDERSLREMYLYNWKPAIADNKGCWGIMTGYNKVSTPNPSYCASNKYLLSTVLRDEWGYRFLVMTDWGANFDNLAEGVNWGTDIQMPDGNVYNVNAISGFPDSVVNVHAKRIILVHEMTGSLVSGYNRTAYVNTVNSAAHAQLVRSIGSAGIVLARNTGNILPIPKTGKTIAITGPFATSCRLGPEGSSRVTPPGASQIDPAKGIKTFLASLGAGATTVTTDLNAADYILVFVGVTGETEGGDRNNLAIQGGEGEGDVSKALAATNGANKTIVIFTGGSAASAGVWSTAPAILIAFYPGQQQGNSIADVLFNNVNPSGKLAVTFPKDASQLPNFNLAGGLLQYPRSDTAHGYFRMDKRGVTPLFWFGHGLSYTTFSYSNLQVFPTKIKAGDRVQVKVTVTNTGDLAGGEVVQLYLSMPQNGSLPTRVQDLRGFTKVFLNAKKDTTIGFQLTAEEMQVWNPNGASYNGSGLWTILPGSYGVRVGTSADRTETPSLAGGFNVQ